MEALTEALLYIRHANGRFVTRDGQKKPPGAMEGTEKVLTFQVAPSAG